MFLGNGEKNYVEQSLIEAKDIVGRMSGVHLGLLPLFTIALDLPSQNYMGLNPRLIAQLDQALKLAEIEEAGNISWENIIDRVERVCLGEIKKIDKENDFLEYAWWLRLDSFLEAVREGLESL